MAFKKCVKCKGTKSVITLGGLHKNCKECKGIGYQEMPDEKEVDTFLEDKDVDLKEMKKVAEKPKTKPGRKKKVA